MDSKEAAWHCATLLADATANIDQSAPPRAVSWDVRVFVAGFVQQSMFVDKLIDAVNLSPAGRKFKWLAADNMSVEARAQQLQLGKAQVQTSRSSLRCARVNQLAYTRARAVQLSKRNSSDVVHMDLQIIRMQPPTFWAALSINHRSDTSKRALVHKIRIFEKTYGKTAIPKPTRERLDHLFQELAEKLQQRRFSYRQWLWNKLHRVC